MFRQVLHTFRRSLVTVKPGGVAALRMESGQFGQRCSASPFFWNVPETEGRQGDFCFNPIVAKNP